MAEKEIYRLDVNVGITGDKEVTKKLSAMDKFTDKTEKRLKKLNKVKASPSAKLNDKASSAIKKVERNAKKLDRVKASPTINIKDKASGKLSKMKTKIGGFSKFAITKFTAIAAAGAVMLGGVGIGSSLTTFADFEQGMKNVQATSTATESELQQMTDTAKQLGKTTSFSAKEASDGMNYLAMAGFKTNEIIESMPGLLDLAAASGTDLAKTSDIVSDALTAFNLKAKDTGHLSDVMAKASSSANTTVEMLGDAFAYAAAPATAFGMSAEETTTALSMMANAGIKGAKGGTALRGALTRLIKPSKEAGMMLDQLGVSVADSHGNIKPFNSIMGDMRTSMAGLTQEQKQQSIATIFGQEAMSGMLAVLNTSTDDFDAYTKGLENADGAAKKMADTKLDSLSGQFTILKSAVEGAKIELGEKLAPYAKQFVSWAVKNLPALADKVVDIADKISSKIPGVINTLKKIAPAIKPTVALLLGLKGISIFSSLKRDTLDVVKTLGLFKGGAAKLAPTLLKTGKVSALATKGFSGMGLAAKAGALLLNPWTIGIGAAAAGGYAFYKHMKQDAIPTVEIFGDKVSKTTKKALGSYMELNDKATKELMYLNFSGAKLTKESADSIVGNFEGMSVKIIESLNENKTKYTGVLTEMLNNSKTFTAEEKNNLVTSIEKGYTEKEEIVRSGMVKINEIVNTSLAEQGIITDEAYAKINEIQSGWQDIAIENMTESQMEQAAILGAMQRQSSEMTAQQAGDVIKNSLEQRNNVVSDANQEYDARIESIDALTALGTHSEATASKLIEEAGRQRDEVVTASDEMHEQVVSKAIEAAGELAIAIDEQTGDTLSKWQSLKKELDGMTFKDKVVNILGKIDNLFKGSPAADSHVRAGYATGTNSATKGVHEVAERGFEVVMGRQHREFSGGEKVLNHEDSKSFLRDKMASGSSGSLSLSKVDKPAPVVKSSGGSNSNSVGIDKIEVNISSGDTGDIEGIVAQAQEEFGRKLLEAIKDKR